MRMVHERDIEKTQEFWPIVPKTTGFYGPGAIIGLVITEIERI